MTARSSRPEILITEWTRSLRKLGLGVVSHWSSEQTKQFELACFRGGLEAIDGHTRALESGEPMAARLNRVINHCDVYLLSQSAWDIKLFSVDEWSWLSSVLHFADGLHAQVLVGAPVRESVAEIRRHLRHRDEMSIELVIARAEMIRPEDANAYRAQVRGYLDALCEFGIIDTARMIELAKRADALLPRPTLAARLRDLFLGPSTVPLAAPSP